MDVLWLESCFLFLYRVVSSELLCFYCDFTRLQPFSAKEYMTAATP